MRQSSWVAIAGAAALMGVGATGAAGFNTLLGSHEKMVRQNTVAHEDHLRFAQTPQDIADEVMARQLVALPGSADYSTKGVSFAFARPQVLDFVERLGHDYHVACGQPMLITSLVRPISRQPRNASPLSVHPAGMAVDLHVPDQPACRAWLVKQLLTYASYNVLDVTEEKHPHHLHVAVFPMAYLAWAAKQPARPGTGRPEAGRSASTAGPATAGVAAPGVSQLDVGRTLEALATTLLLLGTGLALTRPIRARLALRRSQEEDAPRSDGPPPIV